MTTFYQSTTSFGKIVWFGRCQVCSRETRIKPYRVRRGGNYYCSAKCYGRDLADPKSHVSNKREQTYKDRYGEIGRACPTIISKTKATFVERYGVEHPMYYPPSEQKRLATNVARHGTITPQSLRSTVEKRESTNMARYGVSHHMKDPNVARRVTVKALARGDERFRSNEERDLVAWLRDLYGHEGVRVGDNWILRDNIDAFVAPLGLHVQLDGVFWHGLDERLTRPDFVVKRMGKDARLNEWFEQNAARGRKLFRLSDLQWRHVVCSSSFVVLQRALVIAAAGVTLYDGETCSKIVRYHS